MNILAHARVKGAGSEKGGNAAAIMQAIFNCPA